MKNEQAVVVVVAFFLCSGSFRALVRLVRLLLERAGLLRLRLNHSELMPASEKFVSSVFLSEKHSGRERIDFFLRVLQEDGGF